MQTDTLARVFGLLPPDRKAPLTVYEYRFISAFIQEFQQRCDTLYAVMPDHEIISELLRRFIHTRAQPGAAPRDGNAAPERLISVHDARLEAFRNVTLNELESIITKENISLPPIERVLEDLLSNEDYLELRNWVNPDIPDYACAGVYLTFIKNLSIASDHQLYEVFRKIYAYAQWLKAQEALDSQRPRHSLTVITGIFIANRDNANAYLGEETPFWSDPLPADFYRNAEPMRNNGSCTKGGWERGLDHIGSFFKSCKEHHQSKVTTTTRTTAEKKYAVAIYRDLTKEYRIPSELLLTLCLQACVELQAAKKQLPQRRSWLGQFSAPEKFPVGWKIIHEQKTHFRIIDVTTTKPVQLDSISAEFSAALRPWLSAYAEAGQLKQTLETRIKELTSMLSQCGAERKDAYSVIFPSMIALPDPAKTLTHDGFVEDRDYCLEQLRAWFGENCQCQLHDESSVTVFDLSSDQQKFLAQNLCARWEKRQVERIFKKLHALNFSLCEGLVDSDDERESLRRLWLQRAMHCLQWKLTQESGLHPKLISSSGEALDADSLFNPPEGEELRHFQQRIFKRMQDIWQRFGFVEDSFTEPLLVNGINFHDLCHIVFEHLQFPPHTRSPFLTDSHCLAHTLQQMHQQRCALAKSIIQNWCHAMSPVRLHRRDQGPDIKILHLFEGFRENFTQIKDYFDYLNPDWQFCEKIHVRNHLQFVQSKQVDFHGPERSRHLRWVLRNTHSLALTKALVEQGAWSVFYFEECNAHYEIFDEHVLSYLWRNPLCAMQMKSYPHKLNALFWHVAERYQSPELIQILFDYHADPAYQNANVDDETALMRAVRASNSELVQVILSLGSAETLAKQLLIYNHFEKQALDIAISLEQFGIAKQILYAAKQAGILRQLIFTPYPKNNRSRAQEVMGVIIHLTDETLVQAVIHEVFNDDFREMHFSLVENGFSFGMLAEALNTTNLKFSAYVRSLYENFPAHFLVDCNNSLLTIFVLASNLKDYDTLNWLLSIAQAIDYIPKLVFTCSQERDTIYSELLAACRSAVLQWVQRNPYCLGTYAAIFDVPFGKVLADFMLSYAYNKRHDFEELPDELLIKQAQRASTLTDEVWAEKMLTFGLPFRSVVDFHQATTVLQKAMHKMCAHETTFEDAQRSEITQLLTSLDIASQRACVVSPAYTVAFIPGCTRGYDYLRPLSMLDILAQHKTLQCNLNFLKFLRDFNSALLNQALICNGDYLKRLLERLEPLHTKQFDAEDIAKLDLRPDEFIFCEIFELLSHTDVFEVQLRPCITYVRCPLNLPPDNIGVWQGAKVFFECLAKLYVQSESLSLRSLIQEVLFQPNRCVKILAATKNELAYDEYLTHKNELGDDEYLAHELEFDARHALYLLNFSEKFGLLPKLLLNPSYLFRMMVGLKKIVFSSPKSTTRTRLGVPGFSEICLVVEDILKIFRQHPSQWQEMLSFYWVRKNALYDTFYHYVDLLLDRHESEYAAQINPDSSFNYTPRIAGVARSNPQYSFNYAPRNAAEKVFMQLRLRLFSEALEFHTIRQLYELQTVHFSGNSELVRYLHHGCLLPEWDQQPSYSISVRIISHLLHLDRNGLSYVIRNDSEWHFSLLPNSFSTSIELLFDHKNPRYTDIQAFLTEPDANGDPPLCTAIKVLCAQYFFINDLKAFVEHVIDPLFFNISIAQSLKIQIQAAALLSRDRNGNTPLHLIAERINLFLKVNQPQQADFLIALFFNFLAVAQQLGMDDKVLMHQNARRQTLVSLMPDPCKFIQTLLDRGYEARIDCLLSCLRGCFADSWKVLDQYLVIHCKQAEKLLDVLLQSRCKQQFVATDVALWPQHLPVTFLKLLKDQLSNYLFRKDGRTKLAAGLFPPNVRQKMTQATEILSVIHQALNPDMEHPRSQETATTSSPLLQPGFVTVQIMLTALHGECDPADEMHDIVRLFYCGARASIVVEQLKLEQK